MHWEVGGHNFTYISTFVGDVLVKFRHDVFAAVYGGRGAILVELRDAMTAELGHIMIILVCRVSSSSSLSYGVRKDSKSATRKKETGCCFFSLANFNLQSSGSGYWTC